MPVPPAACRYRLQQRGAAVLMLSRVLYQALLGLQLLQFTPSIQHVWSSGFNVVLEAATYPVLEQASTRTQVCHKHSHKHSSLSPVPAAAWPVDAGHQSPVRHLYCPDLPPGMSTWGSMGCMGLHGPDHSSRCCCTQEEFMMLHLLHITAGPGIHKHSALSNARKCHARPAWAQLG